MAPTSPPADLAPSLRNLSLTNPPSPPILDSWDDAPSPTDEAAPAPPPAPPKPPPPPRSRTPDSPSATPDAEKPRKEDRRPEKSTAVAARLIAAGLGVKAPRRTEEQREYERAVRAVERRRKEREAEGERRRREEVERARRAIWED